MVRSGGFNQNMDPFSTLLVINEVSERMEGNRPEYWSDYLRLVAIVKQNH